MFFFFFQAEDGIRDLYVTGVQTCALPISPVPSQSTMVRIWRGIAVTWNASRSPSTRFCARSARSEEHTSELQSRRDLVCRLLLEKKNIQNCSIIALRIVSPSVNFMGAGNV